MMPNMSEVSSKGLKLRPRDVVGELREDMDVEGEVTVVKDVARRVDDDGGLFIFLL